MIRLNNTLFLRFFWIHLLENFTLVLLQEAKEKFQQLQKVISILGDEEKRAVYDQTGSVDDAVSLCFFFFSLIEKIKHLTSVLVFCDFLKPGYFPCSLGSFWRSV